MPVITGAAEYPSEVLSELGDAVEAMDALSLANEAGTAKAVNIVLMGRLAKHFHIAPEKWLAALEAVVNPKFLQPQLQNPYKSYSC